MKEQHREQKLFPQLLQLRCRRKPRSASDVSPSPRHLQTPAPTPVPQLTPPKEPGTTVGPRRCPGGTGHPHGDLPSSSALRRWPSSPYSSLTKRGSSSDSTQPGPLNSHLLLGLLNGDTQEQSPDPETSPDDTQRPIPVHSWGLEAPPASPAKIETHPAEPTPWKPCQAGRDLTTGILQRRQPNDLQ